MVRVTNTMIRVALILLAVIVLGGILRTVSFPRILPEGFEDASSSASKDGVEDMEDSDDGGKKKAGETSKKSDGKDDDDKDDKEKPKKGDAKDDGSKKAKKSTKKSTKEPVDTPPVDFDKNMKNFLSENSDNDELMGSLQKDAKALMKNQEQLMNMLHTTGPMLKSSMDMVKSFKGMFGSA